MQILVLGGTGFLGGHIARASIEKGWHVCCLRRDPLAYGILQDIPIEWVPGDLRDEKSLISALEGMDLVFHTAGYYPKSSERLGLSAHLAQAVQEINNVLQATQEAGVTRMIYTSSLSTIGLPPAGSKRLADERDTYISGTLPHNPYYEVKIAMENAVLESAARGIEAVVVNPTVVLGPGDVHSSSTRFVRSIIQGKVPVYIPTVVNLIDVRDNAAAQITAAERGRSGERYILGGHNLTLLDVLSQAAMIAGVRPPGIRLPVGLPYLIAQVADLIPGIRVSSHIKAIKTWQGYNTEKAESELELTSRPVQETLQDTIRWLRAKDE
jgi:dihydroflavonol-4-reductase